MREGLSGVGRGGWGRGGEHEGFANGGVARDGLQGGACVPMRRSGMLYVGRFSARRGTPIEPRGTMQRDDVT